MVVFFFQAEDGIRDTSVTAVQTCALPICCSPEVVVKPASQPLPDTSASMRTALEERRRGTSYNVVGLVEGIDPVLKNEIGRASCRVRECIWDGESRAERSTPTSEQRHSTM